MTPEERDDLVRRLGFEPNDVAEVSLLPDAIAVRVYLRDAAGRHFSVDDGRGGLITAQRWHKQGYRS